MHHFDALHAEVPRPRTFVLVAVDDQADGFEAVAWAASEAVARRASLEILHVIAWSAFGNADGATGEASLYVAAHRLLDRAAANARRVAPDLAISTRIITGEPAHSIALAGAAAALVVVGRDSTCRSRHRRDRSVTVRVAAWSRCPVAVAGVVRSPTYGGGAGRVVAVLPSPSETFAAWAVLGAAFNAAYRRGVGVTVLADPGDAAEPGGTTIDDLLRQHLRAFTTVDLRRRPLTGVDGSLLLRESQSAALVVYAVPERRLARWRSRAAIGQLLETVPAPVVFVRHRTPRLLTSPLGGSR